VATPNVTPEKGTGGSGLSGIFEAEKPLVSPTVCVNGLNRIGLVISFLETRDDVAADT